MKLKKLDGFKDTQARYRAKNKADGFCIYCKQPRAETSKTLCKRHLEICRAYQATVRDGFKKFKLMQSIHKP